MSLTTGRYWIRPLEKDDMTSKPVRGITITKAGKLVKKPPRMAGHERKRLEGKAKSLEKRWRAKAK